jgi:uncharacterized protein
MMPLLPTTLPFPDPGLDSEDFWDFCQKRQLKFQFCNKCHEPRHPPVPLCPNCQSSEHGWRDAPEIGRIYTYTIVHYASHPDVSDHLPYVVILVEFPEMPGVRLVSNLLSVSAENVKIGMNVQLHWERGPEDTWLPRFTPAD